MRVLEPNLLKCSCKAEPLPQGQVIHRPKINKITFDSQNCVLGLRVRKRCSWNKRTPWGPPRSWLCDSPWSQLVLFILWIHWVAKPVLRLTRSVCTLLGKEMNRHWKCLTCAFVKVILQKFQKPLLEYLVHIEYTKLWFEVHIRCGMILKIKITHMSNIVNSFYMCVVRMLKMYF